MALDVPTQRQTFRCYQATSARTLSSSSTHPRPRSVNPSLLRGPHFAYPFTLVCARSSTLAGLWQFLAPHSPRSDCSHLPSPGAKLPWQHQNKESCHSSIGTPTFWYLPQVSSPLTIEVAYSSRTSRWKLASRALRVCNYFAANSAQSCRKAVVE